MTDIQSFGSFRSDLLSPSDYPKLIRRLPGLFKATDENYAEILTKRYGVDVQDIDRLLLLVEEVSAWSLKVQNSIERTLSMGQDDQERQYWVFDDCLFRQTLDDEWTIICQNAEDWQLFIDSLSDYVKVNKKDVLWLSKGLIPLGKEIVDTMKQKQEQEAIFQKQRARQEYFDSLPKRTSKRLGKLEQQKLEEQQRKEEELYQKQQELLRQQEKKQKEVAIQQELQRAADEEKRKILAEQRERQMKFRNDCSKFRHQFNKQKDVLMDEFRSALEDLSQLSEYQLALLRIIGMSQIKPLLRDARQISQVEQLLKMPSIKLEDLGKQFGSHQLDNLEYVTYRAVSEFGRDEQQDLRSVMHKIIFGEYFTLSNLLEDLKNVPKRDVLSTRLYHALQPMFIVTQQSQVVEANQKA